MTLFFVSIIIFSAVEMLPGDFAKAILGQSATPETVAAFEREIGLDRPPVERYVEWIGQVARGEFGQSFASRIGYRRTVAAIIEPRFFNTLFLAMMTALIAVPLALALGIAAALYRNSFFDRAVNSITLTTISFPEFFIAYMLAFIVISRDTFIGTQFAQSLPQWLAGGIDGFLHLIPKFPTLANVNDQTPFGERVWRSMLPALTLTMVIVAHMMRMTRAAIINLLASPYIEMAQLKGMSPGTHHRAPRAAQCLGADRHRHRLQPRLSRRRRRRRRGGVRLSRASASSWSTPCRAATCRWCRPAP